MRESMKPYERPDVEILWVQDMITASEGHIPGDDLVDAGEIFR